LNNFLKSDQLTKRAFSPFSSVAPACKTLCVKFEGTCKSLAYQKWFRLDVDLIENKEKAIEEHQLTPGCPILIGYRIELVIMQLMGCICPVQTLSEHFSIARV
jgi:hypothetical protein